MLMRQGANSKARKVRRRGVKKGSIHFHTGLLKTQESEDSHCSCDYGCLIALLDFISYYLRLLT